MGLIINDRPKARLDATCLAAFAEIPTTIVSDEHNRFAATSAAIAPLASGSSFVGEALTVQVIAGDNAALHYAIRHASPEAVLALDGGGHLGTAVWGGILHRAAVRADVVAVVIDGAVLDAAELRASPVPVYARGDDDGVVVVPRARIEGLIERCRARLAMDARFEAAIDEGRSTVDLLKLPPPKAY